MKDFNFDISTRSYVPYSNREEHCYVLGESGTVYPGVRVENISFPLTIPAEKSAVCSCLGNKDKPVSFIENESNISIRDFWVRAFDLEKTQQIPENASLFDPLIRDTESIIETLKDLCGISVSGESGFPVTALLIVKDGYIPGVNIEFKEWNLGLCAERVAISRALASGYTDFFGIHIYAPKSEYISPCGACRQVLNELMPDQMVVLHHDEESQTRHFISHLLPNGFTTNSLKK